MTRVTTTCPQCMTIFRVNPEQLAARRGQVRCGRCRHVFNGYETVSVGPDMDENEAAAPVQQARAAIQASGANWLRRMLNRLRSASRAAAGKPATRGERPDSATLRAEGLTQMADLVRSGPSADRVEPGAMRIRPAFGMDAPAGREGGNRAAGRNSARRSLFGNTGLAAASKRQRLWIRLILSLLVLALPFALVAARATVVGLIPASRPIFMAVCTPLKLNVPLPADAERWSVESHELQADGDNAQLFHLVATLRNRSAYTQAFPTVEVNLTDVEGLVVERLVTLPALYLPADHKVADGLPANTEITIKADLRPHTKGSEGYRLVLFYP